MDEDDNQDADERKQSGFGVIPRNLNTEMMKKVEEPVESPNIQRFSIVKEE